MRIETLITNRRINRDAYMDLVYEWEDEFKQALKVPFWYERNFRGKCIVMKWLDRFPLLSFLVRTSKCAFLFEMSDYRTNGLLNEKNYVSCVVDFYLNESLESFVNKHNRNRILFVTSRQAYDFLSAKNLPFGVEHLPISLPTKYKIELKTKFEKKYQLIIAGRPNQVLISYVEEYSKKHPDFVYVKRMIQNGHYFYMTSKGKTIGNVDSREDFLGLLRQAKVGLYTTSGMDNDKEQTNGYHQVTPRFLELLACGCHVIARYECNSDTDYFQMNDYWPSVDSYEQFECQLNKCLSEDPNMQFYSDYLSKHYTIERIRKMQGVIAEI